ncbi:MAG: haloacid dehalogenase, partial [Pedobacter sp.]|nr:haloacid dehalogenase [Pedobacter sp.]
MSSNEYINAHDAFIFELDDVIYPEKDYLLQVYYLFAQFMEYTEQTDGSQMIRFMQDTYAREGEAGLFAKTAVHFNLPEKYQSNYDLLHQNARLPLKLLLFAPVLAFMPEVIAAGKRLFLLTDGDPDMQLNKIKQLEWNGIEKYMAVYFTEEIAKG